MNVETVTAWATAITALGALALIGVTLRVEYLRRWHEKEQFHLKQLRELVFEPLKQEIVGHYLPILERHDGLLRLDTEERSATFDPLRRRAFEWGMKLAVKSASLNPGWSIGENQRFVDYDATFPHLYSDAKNYHFSDLFRRWEIFREQIQQLGEQSLQRCMNWQRRLEKLMQLPVWDGVATPRPWANYAALSLYVYEQLWWRYPNGAGLFEESGYSALRFQSHDLVRGEQEHVKVCLEAVTELVKTESISDWLLLSEQLKKEALTLKGEIERLALTQLSIGSCPYLKVPLF